jgi:hypothetical protein
LIIVNAPSTAVNRFAYVAEDVAGAISEFAVDPATGNLRHRGYVLGGKAPDIRNVSPVCFWGIVSPSQNPMIPARPSN